MPPLVPCNSEPNCSANILDHGLNFQLQASSVVGGATDRSATGWQPTNNNEASVAQLAQNAPSQPQEPAPFTSSVPLSANEDICRLCGEPGMLVCCESCPSAFHIHCLELDAVPSEGEWFCPSCRCDLCSKSDFCSSFSGRTMLLCDQCEREFHVDCIEQHFGQHLTRVPEGQWFCSPACTRVHDGLQKAVFMGKHAGGKIESGYSWQVIRVDPQRAKPNKPQKSLAAALHVLQECFNPVIEPRSGKDLIPMMVYNESSEAADCSGFYTVVLRCAKEVRCAATFRVFGTTAAELPLIGTKFQFRKTGLCRRIVRVVEELLLGMGVKRLVLPAVPSVQKTWARAFGFQKCNTRERLQLSHLSILLFPGTTLMRKDLTPGTLTKYTELAPAAPAPTPAPKGGPGRPPASAKRPATCPLPAGAKKMRPGMLSPAPPFKGFSGSSSSLSSMGSTAPGTPHHLAGGHGLGEAPHTCPEGERPKEKPHRCEDAVWQDTTVLVSGTTRSSRAVRTSASVLEAIRQLAPRTIVRPEGGAPKGGGR